MSDAKDPVEKKSVGDDAECLSCPAAASDSTDALKPADVADVSGLNDAVKNATIAVPGEGGDAVAGEVPVVPGPDAAGDDAESEGDGSGECAEDDAEDEDEDDEDEEEVEEEEDGDLYDRESSSSGAGSEDDLEELLSREAAAAAARAAPTQDVEVCAVCFKKASVRCERCQGESYCGEPHRKKDQPRHDKWCFPRTEPAEDNPIVPQDAPILALSVEVLLRICRRLPAMDLVRLGQTCRALRAVCRDPHAWSHVTWKGGRSSYYGYGGHARGAGVLKVAPALRAIHVGEDELNSPKVNLLRCTRLVKEFHLEWNEYEQEGYDVDRVIALLRHYRGNLDVVKLGCLDRMTREGRKDEVRLLKFIDTLDIKELYVKRKLAKCYPRSSKVITELEMGFEVSGDVLADFVVSCRETLTNFEIDLYYYRKNPWVHVRSSPVRRALVQCHKLESAAVPIWDGSLSMLHAWPELRTLTLYDFGDVKHGAARESLMTAPVAKKLESLTLYMGYFGHRGLLQTVAEACSGLKTLELRFGMVDSRFPEENPIDVPRDLHLVLGRLTDLEMLTLFAARVPSSVLKGIAEGALPNLGSLSLEECALTPKGREAVALVHSKRPDLCFWASDEDVADAKPKSAFDLFFLPSRCGHSSCAAPSDCEEYDFPGDPAAVVAEFANMLGALQ
ncbi:uncharacterized protein LOC117649400 isoform X2 [Thrips palmi]|uniref:Uncharacterized protein LOC117649400 isoform X2 n=1 Tax=Thrips palmi TaxID=161013 RepID=A0A6P8ZS53_THRPL|nr:uncharacterized protein LOC117649400 isoform X2 [Thrips palmi]